MNEISPKSLFKYIEYIHIFDGVKTIKKPILIESESRSLNIYLNKELLERNIKNAEDFLDIEWNIDNAYKNYPIRSKI